MNAPGPRIAVPGPPAAYAAAYERLRAEALAAPAGVRQGPAALVLRGVAAWLDTPLERQPDPTAVPLRGRTPRPPAVPSPVVGVLLDMIRAHLPEAVA